ncbi:glycosyltransferase family 2 protein [Methylococcus capsulatus]|uniref:glycosyltransferase family 2 protein n=1 Tax=Methylococcus capsulatus TaxID=414 RepID=UPI001C5342A3|nr:glycosyltransferase family 2 protein [Methylococcus capsulatus]QXP88570.1 glycosyltransferase family 2 protein [Methylococcus capsulatus]QXP94416.1 glycosyltransferase family 2 protein [Methylococcus capsulatus]UQN13623.1 glycosyltransferase family 2 protein [Methylococcus capsulatus]
MPGIDIVIVNWNSGNQLRECLRSIGNLVGEAEPLTVTVVDNASCDGSADGLPEPSCPLRVIRNRANLGFGRASNLGAREGSADYLLFLNPDTRLHPGALSIPLGFMESETGRHVGICGVQCLDETGGVARCCARFPTAWRLVGQALGLDRLFPRWIPPHFLGEWPHDSDRDVDQVIGAFFFVRRAVFEQLGGFDERFFVYYEDLDFSLRARRAGWGSRYLAGARIFHRGGGVSRQISARRLHYLTHSKLRYARKHFAGIDAFLVSAAVLLLEPLARSAYALGRGRPGEFADTWKAFGGLYASLCRPGENGR